MESKVMLVKGDSAPKPVKLTDLGIRQVIDAGSVINGDFECASSIMVRGTINGNLKVTCNNATVIVHPDGVVNGDVEAQLVIVAGTVKGRISCNGLRLCRTATLVGEFTASAVRIDAGARMEIARSRCASPALDQAAAPAALSQHTPVDTGLKTASAGYWPLNKTEDKVTEFVRRG